MYCTKKLSDDLFWVGGNDRRLSLFEGAYPVPYGISYNSYLLLDEKNVLFDTVDKAVSSIFYENIEHILNGQNLDYVIVQHMEPDHSATLCELLMRHPEATVVCNAKTKTMAEQFFKSEIKPLIVDEKSTLNTGKHELSFIMAPMVHWPEVMVTYDNASKILFSADAFGHFKALNGAIFADEVNFEHDYMDEARRYYCNIVGKYGAQVQALLKKLSDRPINMICPLHGFVWRKNIDLLLRKYVSWSTYEPEETGVLIAYASVYGNTANTAEIIASRLSEMGIKTVMYDTSITHPSEIVAAAFRFSHVIFASTTYNNGIFVSMENLLHDLAAHNFQKRTVGIIQNGSWAPASGKLMREILASCKNVNVIDETLTIKSSLKEAQQDEINNFIYAFAATIPALL